MRPRSTSASRRVAGHRDGCGLGAVERGDIGSSQRVGGVGRSSLSAHLEMLQGYSLRSFQVVIRTCVLGGVPSLFLCGFEPVSDRELQMSSCACVCSGTERRFRAVRYRLWGGNGRQGGRLKDELQERDKGETGRGTGCLVGGAGPKLDGARNVEAVQLRYDGEQDNADRDQIGIASMPWKGGGESRQVKCSANSTNRSKSNVISEQSRPNKVRQGERRRCTRTREAAAQGRQCKKDASLHMACVAGAGMTSLGQRETRGPTGPLGPPLQVANDKASPMIGRIMPLMCEARGHLGFLIYACAPYCRSAALFRLAYPVLCKVIHTTFSRFAYLGWEQYKWYYQTTSSFAAAGCRSATNTHA